MLEESLRPLWYLTEKDKREVLKAFRNGQRLDSILLSNSSSTLRKTESEPNSPQSLAFEGSFSLETSTYQASRYSPR